MGGHCERRDVVGPAPHPGAGWAGGQGPREGGQLTGAGAAAATPGQRATRAQLQTLDFLFECPTSCGGRKWWATWAGKVIFTRGHFKTIQLPQLSDGGCGHGQFHRDSWLSVEIFRLKSPSPEKPTPPGNAWRSGVVLACFISLLSSSSLFDAVLLFLGLWFRFGRFIGLLFAEALKPSPFAQQKSLNLTVKNSKGSACYENGTFYVFLGGFFCLFVF